MLKFVILTWLKTLVPSMRISKRLRSPRAMLRESERFITNIPGPGIVLRPALPNCPAEGRTNAAKLK